MKIGINLLTLEPGKIGGMEQYVRNLIYFTNQMHHRYELFLYLNSRNEQTFLEESNVKKLIISENPIEKELELYKSIIDCNIDVWFCPLLNLEPKFLNIPTVVTIPDLQHEFFPEFFSEEVIEWRRKKLKFSAHQADAVLTLSEFSKETIVNTYNVPSSKVHSIYLDASKELNIEFQTNKLNDIRMKYDLPENYGFYPANSWPHKNHITLLKALKVLKEKHNKFINIVFTGSEHQASKEMKKYVESNKLSKQIHFLGYIDQDDMPYIFKNASFLVFPSLFEGFGIPLVEAMRTETPIICSDKGSIPEVVGDAALLFDALDPEDIAKKIIQVNKQDIREQLISTGKIQAQKFSWEACSSKTLSILDKVHHADNKIIDEYPLITVVTPSYNQGKFIKETIESVLSQDYPNIEYIVMDGGSTDETIEILKSYGDRIQWTSGKDGGQADAVNKGIQVARGEFIGWLNSDDTYLPGAIKEAVQFMLKHKDIGMVYGEGYHTKENGDIIDRYPTESFNYERLAQNCFICQPTAFFRRSIFDKVGLLNKNLHLCMDYELWMRIGKSCEIAYIPYFFATSRMYEDNKTLSRRKEVFKEIIKTVKHHYGYVPISWIYGSVDYKLGPKRNIYFFLILFIYFFTENYKNPSKSLREIFQIIKAQVKFELRKQSMVAQYSDGWVSKKYETTVLVENDSEGNRESKLHILGKNLSPFPKALKIKLYINNVYIKECIIKEKGEFAIDTSVRAGNQKVNLTLIANKTFVPKKLRINNDRRELAYIIDKIEVK